MMRLKLFSKSKKKDDKDAEKINKGIGATSLGAGGIVLATTKPRKLTGKETRYHSTENENVQKILEEGLKKSYSKDPNNLTNKSLGYDVNRPDLVYTSKTKSGARDAGETRNIRKGKKETPDFLVFLGLKKDKYNKNLKLEFDYDELKGKKRIGNPELLGAKDWKELKKKYKKKYPLSSKSDEDYQYLFKALGKNTHIFDEDIDPSHIVGGKGYKKRTLKQIGKYIKNNPGRFSKEAAKVAAGTGAAVYGVSKLTKKKKKEK